MKKTITLLAFLLSISSIFAQSQNKPNVLFIAVDDLKPMLSCYGESQMITPNIDRLAKMGTVFMNNYCQQAVCAPTRASLLTGQRPDYTRIWDLKTQLRDMVPNVVTLPQYFKENGYTTATIGKMFDQRSVDKGMDVPSWTIPAVSYGKFPSNYAAGFEKPVNGYQLPETKAKIAKIEADAKSRGLTGTELTEFLANNKGPAVESADVPDDAYMDGVVAKNAIEMLGKFAKDEKPFFYAVGFVKPHLPFISPKKYWDLYDRSKIKISGVQRMPVGAPDYAAQNSGELYNGYFSSNFERFDSKATSQSEAIQRELIHGYYASVSYMDAQVGKLLDELKKQGLDKNTIIVLWGDHGWHLGDHRLWCKHDNYEQATKAPLIIASPAFKGDQKAQGLSEFVDIFPTLTEMAGLKIPSDLAGKSLVPVLKNPKIELKSFTQSQYPRKGDKMMGYTIRTKRYRYVAWYEQNYRSTIISSTAKPVAVELYDYEKDALETENLASKTAYKAVLKDHEQLMVAFLANQKQSR
jgi:arylsulfatase A-like enzyme